MVVTSKTGKNRKKVKKSKLQLEFENDFSTKVLLSKINVMHEQSACQKEKTKLWHVKGIRVFFRQKWTVAVPIFTLFSFSFFRLIFMPYHIH